MSEDNKIDIEKERLLGDLKKKADLLGVTYSPNIGFDKLKLKIELKMEEVDAPTPQNTTSVGPNKQIISAEETAKQKFLVIINDLDSSTQGEPTIVQTVGNTHFRVGAIITKGVEQYVPKAIIDSLASKTMVRWKDQYHAITKRPTGNKVAETTKRYQIQYV